LGGIFKKYGVWRTLLEYLKDIKHWMAQNFLMLNKEKNRG